MVNISEVWKVEYMEINVLQSTSITYSASHQFVD